MAMDTSKLVPNDSRVRKASFVTRGLTYQYIIGEPPNQPPADTIFLFHGFPETSFGWRYQIPPLMAQGFRVVVPDLLGYAGSSTPANLQDMALKKISEDMKQLALHVTGSHGGIFIGGHDWGGHLAWRMAMWQPELIKGVFSVCTPFFVPNPLDFEALIKAGKYPNFRYQLQFMGPDVEREIQGEAQVRQFINAIFFGTSADDKLAISAEKGIHFEILPMIQKTPLETEEELQHHVAQFMLQKAPQMRGPLYWYRMGGINRNDEKSLSEEAMIFRMPTLFIAAKKDFALPPHLSQGMESYMPHLTRGEVDSTHWALIEAAEEVNSIISKWLKDIKSETGKASL